MTKVKTSPLIKTTRETFLKHSGFLRASEALAEGIRPRELAELRDQGEIELISRGLYRLKKLPALKSPELFTVGAKIPQGIICLTSSLAFHKLIEQTPKEISIALVKGAQRPRIRDLPVKFYWISEPAFSEGVEAHKQDGVDLRIYSAEKTLADCFKFRNQIGLEICLEGLRKWIKHKDSDTQKLLSFAKGCRVEKIIRPYLDALSTSR